MALVSFLKLYTQFDTGYSFVGKLGIAMNSVISTPFHVALLLALDDYCGLSCGASD